MANYLYQTTLWTETSNVVGLNTSQNATDLADYENNRRSSTVKIDDIQIAETTFMSQFDYTAFKGLIVSPIDWGDVKEVDHGTHYDLYVISVDPL